MSILSLLDVFDFPVKFLRLIGLWGTPFKRSAIIHLLPISFLILQICFLSSSTSFDDVTEQLTIMFTYIGTYLKVINNLLKMPKVERMMTTLRELLQHKSWLERNNYKKLEATVLGPNKIFKIYVSLAMFATIPDILMALSSQAVMHKMYMPDENNKIVIFSAIIYQFSNNLLCIVLTITLDFVPIFFIAFAVGLYEELRILLDTDEITSNLTELKQLIEIDLKIRGFINEIIDCFSTIMLIHAGFIAFVMCTSAFVLSQVRNDNL